MNIAPYDKNAKKHPTSQLKALADIVALVGWRQPILVNQQGIIVVGHGRMMAYQMFKDICNLKEPWVVDDKGNTVSGNAETEPLTEEQERIYRLADNKLNESDWDMKLVVEDLKLVPLPLLELTGFSKDLILEPEDKDDEIPDVPDEPQSQLGDVYELGPHRIVCGDSTKDEDVAKLMNGHKTDLWLTDPPYNVAYEGKTKDALTIQNDSMSDESFLDFLTAAFDVAATNIKSGASFYIWHADSEGYNFRKAALEAGLNVRQCLIWVKNTMVMGRQDYQWKHEPCLYGWKEGSSHSFYADRKQTTVLNFDKPTKSTLHPTMKPVELFSYQITNSTKEEDIVLDTFSGSGSTLIACEKTGRTCYGMELDPKYVDVIIQRYVDYTENCGIIKNGEPYIWPLTQKDESKEDEE